MAASCWNAASAPSGSLQRRRSSPRAARERSGEVGGTTWQPAEIVSSAAASQKRGATGTLGEREDTFIFLSSSSFRIPTRWLRRTPGSLRLHRYHFPERRDDHGMITCFLIVAKAQGSAGLQPASWLDTLSAGKEDRFGEKCDDRRRAPPASDSQSLCRPSAGRG